MNAEFIPLIVLFTFFGLVYLGLRAHQMRNIHRERMAALEKGVDIKPILLNATPAFGHRIYLLRGLVWLFAGAALLVALTVIAPAWERSDNPADRLQSKLMRARNFKDMGATDAQIMAMENELQRAEHQRPNPRLIGLVGLVPMFAGLAFLVFYGLEERRVRAVPPS